ncbi:MAG: acetyl-CoA C-acetyltransferase [Candidatus Lokiarchaeota archaeon]|nr:acetyl-CoA C-acetyltransferase [Candidatus Lokiarchaeota archaeon]
MADAVIAGFVRTPISRSRPDQPDKDVFNGMRADDLAIACINELLERTRVPAAQIDDCLIGCAFAVNENWTDGGRLVTLSAGLPFEVPATCIDRQCASSLTTIQMGAMEVMTGTASNGLVIAGGMEHMTRVPMSLLGSMKLNEKFTSDPRFDAKTALSMGLTAEKLFAESGLTKADMDAWALRSHARAAEALKQGFFAGEIMPVEVVTADGKKQTIKDDQSIRGDTTLEKIAGLKPAFRDDGFITAGNSSPLNAGAAFTLLASEGAAKRHGLEPMATIRAMSVAGVDPTVMGKGPVPASKKVLEKAGLKAKDVDFWEINEAFAIVPLYAIKALGIDPEQVNVKGGAIALGHPLGASGARIAGTLARILAEKGARYGIATLCVGGGQGAAILLERD